MLFLLGHRSHRSLKTQSSMLSHIASVAMTRNRQRIAGWGINPFGDKPENGINKGVCGQEEGKGSGPTREAEELEQKLGDSRSCFCWHFQLPRNVNTTGAGPLNAICHFPVRI